MSKNEATASQEGQGEAKHDSVFDFLYHDGRRLASFLSQFDNNGHLTAITQADSVTKGVKRSKKVEFGADVPILGGGTVGFEIGPGETGSQNLERAYDPFWTNARLFLDFLTERKLLQRDLDAANIGQFVLATGYLSIQDLAMFKDAWKLPSIQKKVKAGVGVKKLGNMTSAQKAAHQEEQENTQIFLDMLQIMPHSVHARMITSAERAKLVWCTLNRDYLVAPASDITLTYGETMSGEWSIVGILSAHPEYLTPDFNQSENFADPGLMQSIVGQISKLLAPIVRVALGRPAAAHAITPLLIFREAS